VDDKEKSLSLRSNSVLINKKLVQKSQPPNIYNAHVDDVKYEKKHTPDSSEGIKNNSKFYGSKEPQDVKKYTIINELSKSDYFGEISIMTKIPATATIHVVAHTI
jgi:hypothetical protein